MKSKHSFAYFLLYLNVILLDVICLHIKGTWNTNTQYYRFLSKFGIQKTDNKDKANSEGFIYGNITTKNISLVKHSLTFVFVDSEYFLEYHGNRTSNSPNSCNAMFNKIDQIAYDNPCRQNGKEDFLRRIPCPKGQLCPDEDEPKNLIPGYQFTYRVQDLKNPRFWYLSMVACYRNTTANNCSWVRSSQNLELDYDIWLVNGDPASKHQNPFEHQFSFEDHDIVESYAVFFALYLIIIFIWLYAYFKQKHTITKILTASICLELTGISCNLLHWMIFSANGVGCYVLSVIGNAIDVISECLFMLTLLLITKGWTITSMELTGKPIVFSIWGLYTLLNCVLFIWNLTEVDVISNIDEWQTWPGYITLIFRCFIMVWFMVELRQIVRYSKHPDRLLFIQQFGAYFLVWFIYLPILAIISTQFSALWKHKIILNIINGADWLSYMVLIHLLWPSRSILYLIKGDTPLPTYELEITGLLDDQETTPGFFKGSKALDIEMNHNTIPNKEKRKVRNGHLSLPLLEEEEDNDEF
ncbi:integral membrane protein GPR180-like [Mytilus galloprovincialis]|uniref:integral membrane protein GPR180-like n=1 Tax=Mytilus galloprovincialis TaxID=29158 RepID=UPI003F7CB2E4